MDLSLLDWNDYTIRNVVLGTAWIGIVSGALGCLALLRRQSLLGDVISHATLPGVVFAFLLVQRRDMGTLMTGAAIAGMAATFFIFLVDSQTRIWRDGAMGTALALFFGIGVFLLSLTQRLPTAQKAGLSKFIFGQAAALVESDVSVLVWTGVPVLILLVILWKEFKLVTFDPGFAFNIGLPVRGLEILLTFLVVITIVMGLQAVGVILMSAILIAPAAAARQWTNRMGFMIPIAACLGALSSASGAVISAMGPHIPTGPVIVLFLSGLTILSLFFGFRRGIVWRWHRSRRSHTYVQEEGVLSVLQELWEQHGREHHGHSQEVIQLARFGQGNVRPALERLQSSGLVKAEQDGKWSLTEKGTESGHPNFGTTRNV